MRLYHGTDRDSALALLDGEDLDLYVATERHVNGAPGFYLASSQNDAVYFAARRAPGSILIVDITDDALAELLAGGAIRRHIPESPGSASFEGDEVYLPPALFGTFDEMRRAARIKVSYVRRN